MFRGVVWRGGKASLRVAVAPGLAPALAPGSEARTAAVTPALVVLPALIVVVAPTASPIRPHTTGFHGSPANQRLAFSSADQSTSSRTSPWITLWCVSGALLVQGGHETTCYPTWDLGRAVRAVRA